MYVQPDAQKYIPTFINYSFIKKKKKNRLIIIIIE